MRRARSRLIVTPPSPQDWLPALEAHRDRHFRRVPARRIRSDRAALAFINQVGFCTAFTAGLNTPCLREAIVGAREPPLPEHLQHDYAVGMTWRLKDVLPARRLVYYGKVIAGRPGFVARSMLSAFLRLRVEPGGYRLLYRRGRLSHPAKQIMDALESRGPSDTRTLKLASGRAQPSRRGEFDRAMKELQEKFLAVKIEERYEPFTYVWDTVQRRWSDAMREARPLRRSEAACRLVRRFFEVSGFGSERTVSRVLGVSPMLTEAALARLEQEHRIVRGIRLNGHPGTLNVLAEYAPPSGDCVR